MLKLLKDWFAKLKLALTGIPLSEDKVPKITSPESQYEEQIKWQITLTGRSTNEKIVDFCIGKTPDTRHVMKSALLTEEQLKWLKDSKYDVDGKPYIYRGKPSYRIKE